MSTSIWKKYKNDRPVELWVSHFQSNPFICARLLSLALQVIPGLTAAFAASLVLAWREVEYRKDGWHVWDLVVWTSKPLQNIANQTEQRIYSALWNQETTFRLWLFLYVKLYPMYLLIFPWDLRRNSEHNLWTKLLPRGSRTNGHPQGLAFLPTCPDIRAGFRYINFIHSVSWKIM